MVRNLRKNINSKVNTFAGVSNRFDQSKVSLNSSFNDVPSADIVVNQKKLEPNTTKSTIGLLGFEGDSGTLDDRVLLGQNISEEMAIQRFINEQFGTVQVEHKTDGGTQTKTINVTSEMAQTVDQRKLISMTEEQKSRFQSVLNKLLGNQNGIAIQKATHDEVVDPQGKRTVKSQIRSSSGLRLGVDGLNASINQFISNLSGKRRNIKNKKVNAETVDTERVNIDLDSPLTGNFQ